MQKDVVIIRTPTIEQAHKFLEEAEKLNSGKWVDHVKVAAQSAQKIAEKTNNLNPEAAYVCALLHDIGRRNGVSHLKHTIDGYRYLVAEGFPDVADICLTHSFVIKNVNAYSGNLDCSPDDIQFIQDFITKREYNDYDKLVQLCDAVALPTGAVLIEKRLLDVTMRYGFNDFTLLKWQGYFDLKVYFEGKCGYSIYSLLPNVTENTFN